MEKPLKTPQHFFLSSSFCKQHPLRSLRFLGVYNSFTTGNRDPIENSCGKLEFTTAKNSPPQPQAQFFILYRENGKFFSKDPKMKQSGGGELYVRTQPALFYCNLKSFLN